MSSRGRPRSAERLSSRCSRSLSRRRRRGDGGEDTGRRREITGSRDVLLIVDDDRRPRSPSRRRGRSRSPLRRGRSHSRRRRRSSSRRRSRTPSAERRRRDEEERERRREKERLKQQLLKEQREQRAKERAENEPSENIQMSGIPDDGSVTEERLEAVAWEVAVKASCSMPNGVRFVFDEAASEFKGLAMLEFPHKDASKMFKDHAAGVMEVDGFKLTLTYHHEREPTPSPSRETRDKPAGEKASSTLIVKGILSTTPETELVAAFQAYASVRDIRYFPKRGFAFIMFHGVDEARAALTGFERELRCRIDGQRVTASFAQDRDQKQQMAAEQAAEEAVAMMDKIAVQQMQQENTVKALSGVNAGMWASYMNSVAQTETVQSANTFEYDRESGYYKDAKAELYYDPNTTYFFTLDHKKYFLYDHDIQKLVQIDKAGKKIEGGEIRQMPGHEVKSKESRSFRDVRDRAKPRSRSKKRGSSRSAERERQRKLQIWAGKKPTDPKDEAAESAKKLADLKNRADQAKGKGKQKEKAKEEPTCLLDRFKPKEPMHKPIYFPDGDPLGYKPIHYPGGDPLAKLGQATAGSPQAPAPQKKKKKNEVLGLAEMTSPEVANAPGRITVFKPGGGASPSQPAVTSPVMASPVMASPVVAGPVPFSQPLYQEAPDARTEEFRRNWKNMQSMVVEASAAPPTPGPPALDFNEWICEICMRKFASQEKLLQHEQFSDLHKANLAKLDADL